MTRAELIKFTDQQHEIAKHAQAIQCVMGCAADRATEIVFRLIWHGRNPVIFYRAIVVGYGYKKAAQIARLTEAEAMFLLTENPRRRSETIS